MEVVSWVVEGRIRRAEEGLKRIAGQRTAGLLTNLD